MKENKKLLCLVLTVAFLLCISTTAFAATQLGTPTDLQWNEVGPYVNGIQTGTVSWNAVANCEGNYYVTLYKDGQVIHKGGWRGMYDSDDDGKIYNSWPITENINESGSYTFSVYAQGDGTNFTDSAVATSPAWNYAKPATQLAVPTGLQWKDNSAYWNAVPNAYGYSIDYFKDGNVVGSIVGIVEEDANGLCHDDHNYLLEIMDEHGKGVYTFAVRAISKDITQIANGEWSAQSAGNDVSEIVTEISGKLDNWNSEMGAATTTTESAIDLIQNEVYGTASDELAVAMASDNKTERDNVLMKVSELEEAYKDITGIDVVVTATEDSYTNANQVKIVGAALNSTTKDTAVELNLSKPSKTYTLDPLEYKNMVQLSMKLEKVSLNEDGKLKVPVYITMPVPDNLDIPKNLVILHYYNDGKDVEEIHPNFNENYTMASFMLTHFSDFVFAEKVVTEPSRPSTGGSSGGFSGSYNYPVKADDVDGATVSFDKSNAVAGEKVVITVTPDAGKQVDEVIVTDADNEVIAVTKVGDNKYSFIMPEGAVKVAVTTEKADYDTRVVLQIGNRNVVNDNQTFTNDVAPVIVGNRTMVPIRVITEALGGTADWNEAARTVTLRINGKILRMTIDQTIAGFDAAPVIINSRTYVPIRYVAEALGANVEWIADTQQIIIEK